MNILVIILGIIIIMIGTQVWALTKFIKQIKSGEYADQKTYKIFRGIWLVVDGIAFLTTVLFIYTCIKSSYIVSDYTTQAYGWVPFIVFIFMVLPSNIAGGILRIIYVTKGA